MIKPPYNFDHNDPVIEHAPAISKKWKRAAVVGNLALGVAELLTGNFRSLSVAADGLHNLGDAATYKLQSDDILNEKLSAEKIKKRRKVAYWAIAASSAVVSTKAGFDFADGATHQSENFGIYAASISLAYSSGLLVRLRQGMKREHQILEHSHDCHKEKDLQKHLIQLDMPSAVLAVSGAIGQKYGFQDAEHLAAMASGFLGVVAFRPTAKNLSHEH